MIQPSPIPEKDYTTRLRSNQKENQQLQQHQPSNRSSRSEKKKFILIYSIVKHVQGWEIMKKKKKTNVCRA